jgi:hypothetical protein
VQHSLLEWVLFSGFMVGLLGGMVAFGWYCMVGLVGWVAGGQLTRRQVAAVLGGISLGSLLVAGIARLLGCWDWVFLVAVATMFGCGIAAWVFIQVGKALCYLAARRHHLDVGLKATIRVAKALRYLRRGKG